MFGKRKERDVLSLSYALYGIAIIICLTWINTFIHQHSFEGFYGDFEFLKIALISMGCTVFYYWLLLSDPMPVLTRDSTKMCAAIASISGIIMLISLLVELGTDGFSLYGQSDIVLWWITIPKKYFYDIWAIIWFPMNITGIFKALKREHFQKTSIVFASIAISELTLEGILIFRPMSANIYQVDLIVLNTITLALAIWIYVIPDTHVRRGNAVAAIILYTITRILMLPLQCNNWGKKFSVFMYGDNYDNLLSGIREIIHNASMFGTSSYLQNSKFVLNWLEDRNKPVAQLLYYGGWVAVIVFIGLLVLMVYVLIKLLGVKKSRVHANWLMFATAVAMLSSRAFFGILYNFGIPFPVGLPFMGNDASRMDVMAFVLIIICAMENRKISRYERLPETFVQVEKVLGTSDNYTVLDEDGDPYTEEIYKDDVDIVTQEGRIRCNADWYNFEEREFCVFTKGSLLEDKERFILEYADGKWIIPTDFNNHIKEHIIELFVSLNQPDCMEEWSDEEEDNED